MNKLAVPYTSKKTIAYIFFGLIGIYVLYRYRLTIVDIIKPFFLAALIAYLLNPIVLMFERRGLKRIVSIIFVFLIFSLLIFLLCFILMPRLVKDIAVLIENIPTYSMKVESLVRRFQDGYLNSNLPQSFKDIIDQNIQTLQHMILVILQKIADSILSSFSELFNVIITPVLAFYMLKDACYFKSQFILLLPKKKRNKAIFLFRDIDNAFGKFIRGQIIVAVFVGMLTSFLLLMIKVKYALVLGVFAGVSNIIPYFGPFIGLVPTVIFALLDSPTRALYAAFCFLLVQQIESSIISPKIIGESVGIHPIYVILALIVGGKCLGLLGLVIAVPVLAAIKLTFRHILRPAEFK